MRLSTDADRDEERALATIVAAVEAGITVFDTARAYGDNEQLLARALRSADATTARIVTKGGMTRPGRSMAAGRQGALGSSRLRGEPRGARRLVDRRLPPPRD